MDIIVLPMFLAWNYSQRSRQNKSVNVRNSDDTDVADELIINAGKRMLLKCGQSTILLNADGSIQINGKTLSKNFSDIIKMVSEIIKVN